LVFSLLFEGSFWRFFFYAFKSCWTQSAQKIIPFLLSRISFAQIVNWSSTWGVGPLLQFCRMQHCHCHCHTATATARPAIALPLHCHAKKIEGRDMPPLQTYRNSEVVGCRNISLAPTRYPYSASATNPPYPPCMESETIMGDAPCCSAPPPEASQGCEKQGGYGLWFSSPHKVRRATCLFLDLILIPKSKENLKIHHTNQLRISNCHLYVGPFDCHFSRWGGSMLIYVQIFPFVSLLRAIDFGPR
jgi:hypothetical protein